MSRERVLESSSRNSTPDVDTSDVNLAFDPEARQAQQDWQDYLKSRDYADQRGNVHDAKSGQFKTVDFKRDDNESYYNEFIDRADTSGEGSRKDWGVIKLAKAAREARERGDRTSLGDIEDEIQERLIAMGEKYDWDNDQSDAHLDKINAIIHGSDLEDTDASSKKGRSRESESGDLKDKTVNDSNIDTANKPDTESGEDVGEKVDLPFSQEEIDEARGDMSAEGGDVSVDATGKELELYEKSDPEKRKIEAAKLCADYLRNNHPELIDDLAKKRDEFLEVMAKSQKGHLRRIRPGGATEMLLRTLAGKLGGNKVADYLTKPSKKEAVAGDDFAEAFERLDEQSKSFLGGQVELGNISKEELHQLRLERFTAMHAANALEIAKIQERDGHKPVNKWLRRAGYVAAGIGGGLLALTPMSWIGIAAGGMAGAGIRVFSNKRNANLVDKDSKSSAARAQANKNIADFKNITDNRKQTAEKNGGQFEQSIENVIKSHHDETGNEIGKNRNRLVLPALGAIAAGLAAKYGIEMWNANSNGDVGEINRQGEGTYEPPKSVDEEPAKPETVPPVPTTTSETGTPPPETGNFTTINTNGAPEQAMANLTGQNSSEAGATITRLSNEIGMDNIFVDRGGNPVDLTNFGGKIGIGYQPWDTNMDIRLSDEAQRVMGNW